MVTGNFHYDFISHKSDVAMTVAQFVFKVFSHTFEDESQARCFYFPLNGKVPLLSTKLADQSPVLLASLTNMSSLIFCYFVYLWKIMICSGTLLKVEPSEITNENILAMFNTATITDCWMKCKKTKNCKAITSKTGDSNVITNSKNQINCYLLKANKKTEVSSMVASLQINKIGPITVRRSSANTVFPLISILGAYQIFKLLVMSLIRGWH